MSLLITTKNIASQALAVNGLVNLGSVTRKYCKKNSCGLPTFSFNGTGISLQTPGVYNVIATIVASGSAAGDVTFQLNENGVAIPGALSTETITTANTEFRTFTILTTVLVDENCVLNTRQTMVKNLSITNTGIASTVTNIVVDITKEV